MAMPLESGVPFCVSFWDHSPALLSCAGVNAFLLRQLFEDEKCHGRALLLLARMKRSAPDPTVLCLATGCHSCSTHNAAESRKEKCLPSTGQQQFPEPLLVLCTLLRGLGSSPRLVLG